MFKCPYCFASISDNHVHFRSYRVNTGENPEIPDDYDDAQDFQTRYRGANKDDILQDQMSGIPRFGKVTEVRQRSLIRFRTSLNMQAMNER